MLLILSSFFKKISTFLKTYWQYIAVFFAGVASVLWARRKPITDDSKDTWDAHDKQLDAINDVRKDERTKTDASNEKLERDLATVERQYEDHKKNLDEKKKNEIKSILEKHQDDPVALAKRLSAATGFKVIMPEE